MEIYIDSGSCQCIVNTNQLLKASSNGVFLLHTRNLLKEIKFKEFLTLVVNSKGVKFIKML